MRSPESRTVLKERPFPKRAAGEAITAGIEGLEFGIRAKAVPIGTSLNEQ